MWNFMFFHKIWPFKLSNQLLYYFIYFQSIKKKIDHVNLPEKQESAIISTIIEIWKQESIFSKNTPKSVDFRPKKKTVYLLTCIGQLVSKSGVIFFDTFYTCSGWMLSWGDVLVWVVPVDLAHGFDNNRFSVTTQVNHKIIECN